MRDLRCSANNDNVRSGYRSRFGPERIRRRSDDPFFDAGDMIACQANGLLTSFFYIDDEEGNDNDVGGCGLHEGLRGAELEDNDDRGYHYRCAVPGCAETFESITKCEEHYQLAHVHECSLCKRSFPSDHWLDLHIRESHDSFFSVCMERNRERLRCLIPTCDYVFVNESQRLLHLKSMHSFPKWFRFHPRSRMRYDEDSKGNVSITRRAKGDIQNNRTNETNFRSSKMGNVVHRTTSTLTTVVEQGLINNAANDVVRIIVDLSPEEKKKYKRRERKERKKQLHARTRCKFFHSVEGCRRGSSCMFLHDSFSTDRNSNIILMDGNLNNENNFGKNNSNHCTVDDVHMDELEGLTSKMKVSLPEKIKFGGKRTARKC